MDQGRVVALILLGCGALGAAAVAALAVGQRRFQPSRSVRLAFAGLLALLALGAAGAVLVYFDGPVALVEDAYDSFKAPPEEDPEELERRLFSFSGSYRTELWEAAWDDYRDNPVLGSGPERTSSTGTATVRSATSSATPTACTWRRSPSWGRRTDPVRACLRRSAGRGGRSPARALAVGALGAYVVYLVHAGLDWDWELTGLTAPALACGVALLLLRPTTSSPVIPAAQARIAGASSPSHSPQSPSSGSPVRARAG